MSAYAELAVTTNFSFLRGASHPREMVETADALGQFAVGIADRNSFAGVVRAYDEAKNRTIKLMVGTRLVTIDGFEVLAYPTDRPAYGRLCRLLTAGNLAAPKGECHLTFEHILGASEGQMLIAIPPDLPPPPPFGIAEASRRSSRTAAEGRLSPALASRERINNFPVRLAALVEAAPGRAFLAGIHYHRGDEPRRLGLLAELGKATGAPLVAVNDVHYHVPERRALLDVLTCVREKCTIAEAGLRLAVNAERHLKGPEEMARLFARFPDAVARIVEIAEACAFSLGTLQYEYPDEPVPPGKTAQQHLEDLTWAGGRERYPRDKYPDGIPADVQARLERRACAHRQARLRALFPHRARYRALCAPAGKRNSLPGPRLGGQQRGVLLPRHHLGQPGKDQAAVRPLHLREPRRAARYRRRFRARTARRGDPIYLPALRARPRRDLLDRGALPFAPRHPRSRQSHGADGGRDRGAGENRLGLWRRPARRACAPGRA